MLINQLFWVVIYVQSNTVDPWGGGVEGVVLPNMGYIQKQGFQNKPVAAGVPPATSRQIAF